MVPLATFISPGDSKKVRITWAAPNANGAPITAYHIEIANHNKSAYSASSECDGTTDPDLANLYCEVLLTTLTNVANAWDLVEGSQVIVRAKATNAEGQCTTWSNENTVSIALVEVVPLAPLTTPTINAGNTHTSAISMDYTALPTTRNGGSTVTSYVIYWNGGSGAVFSILYGDAEVNILTTYTKNSGITNGGTYLLKYAAKNRQGIGAISPQVSIIAGTIPVANVPTIARTGRTYDFTWTAVSGANLGGTGLTITTYALHILQKDGNYG